MNESTVFSSIKKSNRSFTIFGILALLVALGIIAIFFKSIIAYIAGPVNVEPATLATYQYAKDAPRPWVNVDGLGLYDTGYKMFESKDGGPEYVTDSYSALDLGNDKYILVKQKGDLNDNVNQEITVNGELMPFDSDEQTGIYDDILSENPALKENLVPFKLETSNFRSSNWAIIPSILIFGLAGLFLLFQGVRRSGDITKHPIYKSLSRHGENVESTISQIEGELAQPHTTIGKVLHITRNWVIQSAGGTFEAMKLEDLAWVYRHVQTTRSYGIPVSKTHSLFIFDKFKKKMQPIFGRKEQDALDGLEAIYQQAPWAIYGYDDATQKRWNKENEAFLADVSRRKMQGDQGYPAEPLDTGFSEDETQQQ